MMEMPERIYLPNVDRFSNMCSDEPWPDELGSVEYLRADIAQKAAEELATALATIEALTGELARLKLQIAQMGEVNTAHFGSGKTKEEGEL